MPTIYDTADAFKEFLGNVTELDGVNVFVNRSRELAPEVIKEISKGTKPTILITRAGGRNGNVNDLTSHNLLSSYIVQYATTTTLAKDRDIGTDVQALLRSCHGWPKDAPVTQRSRYESDRAVENANQYIHEVSFTIPTPCIK